MTWEKRRKTPARYLTKSTRVDGRVKRDYIGTMSDPLVANLARCDRLTLANKQAQREVRKEESKRYETIRSAIDQYWNQLEAVLDEWLKRRQYRRQRKMHWVKTERKTMKIHKPPQDVRKTISLTRDEFDTLLKKAELGNADAIHELRDRMSDDWDIWKPFGDLKEHVKLTFLALMAESSVVAQESMSLRIQELANDLHLPNQSPMRTLVVDAVVTSWLDYHYTLMLSTESSEIKGRAEQLERRLQRAQKRYLEAIECLERISKLENSREVAEQSC